MLGGEKMRQQFVQYSAPLPMANFVQLEGADFLEIKRFIHSCCTAVFETSYTRYMFEFNIQIYRD